MADNGHTPAEWGCTIEGEPSPMLRAALRSLQRGGAGPQLLPPCGGEVCDWVRRVAECLHRGTCRKAVLFCNDPGLACCVANKVPGVRAVAVWTVAQARRARAALRANLLVVEMAGRTYFECRELLRLCSDGAGGPCPAGVACVLEALDGHAHR